jgi:hypothetical protein
MHPAFEPARAGESNGCGVMAVEEEDFVKGSLRVRRS